VASRYRTPCAAFIVVSVLIVAYLAFTPRDVVAETGDVPDLEVLSVEGDNDLHHAFLEHEVVEGVSVASATLAHLADRAAASPDFSLSRWRASRTGDGGCRFALDWRDGDGEASGRETAAFRYYPDAERLEPATSAAEAIAATADKLDETGPWAVHPTSYVPEPADGEPHWTGRARKVCGNPTFAENCRTMEAFFQGRAEVLDGLSRVLEVFVERREQLVALREAGECTWQIVDRLKGARQDWASHRVVYQCAGQRFQWNFERENGRLSALESMAHLLAQVGSIERNPDESAPGLVGVDLRETRRAVREAAAAGGDSD
jgi:hypothetical protein